MSLLLIEKIVIALGAVVFAATGWSYRDENRKLTSDGKGLILAAGAMVIDLISLSLLNFGLLLPIVVISLIIHGIIKWETIEKSKRLLTLMLGIVIFYVAIINIKNTAGGENVGDFILISTCAIGFLGHRIKNGGSKLSALPAGLFAVGIFVLDIINQILT